MIKVGQTGMSTNKIYSKFQMGIKNPKANTGKLVTPYSTQFQLLVAC